MNTNCCSSCYGRWDVCKNTSCTCHASNPIHSNIGEEGCCESCKSYNKNRNEFYCRFDSCSCHTPKNISEDKTAGGVLARPIIEDILDGKFSTTSEEAWESKITTLVGEATMCWNPAPMGVFDSEDAMRVSFEICKLISKLLEEQQQKTGKAYMDGFDEGQVSGMKLGRIKSCNNTLWRTLRKR